MFPEARVEIVDRQRLIRPAGRSRVHPIVAGKRILMIGEASSFVRRFDGCLGDGVRCAPYLKLVPVSNGCPYYCTYCYLAYVYRDYLPLIKMNVNYGKMFEEIREAAFDCSEHGRVQHGGDARQPGPGPRHIAGRNDLVPFFSRSAQHAT